MNIGGSFLELPHDCHVCVKLREKFGTCEYMHQANPGQCSCSYTRETEKRSEQSVLQTESTVRVRLAFWRRWAETEGVKMGLMVPLEDQRPNLPKIPHKDEE